MADRRKLVYLESSLPYSFGYIIPRFFYGKPCPICGNLMQAGIFEGRRFIPTIQHNLPISLGGKHELGNISIICKQCNITIKNRTTSDLNAIEVTKTWKMCVASKRGKNYGGA